MQSTVHWKPYGTTAKSQTCAQEPFWQLLLHLQPQHYCSFSAMISRQSGRCRAQSALEQALRAHGAAEQGKGPVQWVQERWGLVWQ